MASEEKSLSTLVVIIVTALAGIGGTLHFSKSSKDAASADKPESSSTATTVSPADADTEPKTAFACIREHLEIYRAADGDDDGKQASGSRAGTGLGWDRVPFLADLELRLKLLASETHDDEQTSVQKRRKNSLEAEVRRLAQCCAPSGPNIDVDFIIATLPDPQQSHLQAVFDLQVSALQLAAQQFGYLIDRIELPWSADNVAGESKGKADFHRRPGVLLFRHEAASAKVGTPDCRFLVIFLVGELPTSGVHKPALADAFEQIAAWHRNRPKTEHVTLKDFRAQIVAPSFSGSADSLRACMDEWWARTDKNQFDKAEICIISGSATSARNQQVLGFSRRSNGLKSDFNATVYPDDATMEEVIKYLENEKGLEPSQIALLVEYGTGYGNSFKSELGHEKQSPGLLNDLLRFPYPLEIGSLRSAYDSQPALKYGPTPAQQHGDSLEVVLESPAKAKDTLPKFSLNAAVWAERQLGEILNAISRRRIRAVGLVGTDSMDILFLAQQLHLHAPDKVLFTLDNNLLYTHNDYRIAAEGMLIASTYPLFTENQFWTAHPKLGNNLSLQFKSDGQEGTYNAAVAQLKKISSAKHRSDPWTNLVDYCPPFDAASKDRRPPLWLLVVGKGGIWPVKTFDLDKRDRKYVVADAIVAKPRQPNLPELPKMVPPMPLVVVASTGLCAVVVSAFRRRVKAPKTTKQSEAKPIFPVTEFEAIGWVAAIGGLSLIQLLVCSPAWIYFVRRDSFGMPEHDGRAWWVIVPCSFLAAAGLIVSLVHSPCLWRPGESRQPNERRRAVLVSIALGGIILWLVCLLWPQTPLDDAIFVQRMGHPSSGVSFLTPAVLFSGVIVLAAWCQIRGALFCWQSPFAAPAHVEGPNYKQQACLQLNNVFDCIRSQKTGITKLWPHGHRSSTLVVVSVLGVAAYFFLWRWIAAAETRGVQYFLSALALLSIVSVLMILRKLIEISSGFRRVLTELAKHPIVDAFSDLPAHMDVQMSSFVWSAYSSGDDRSDILHALSRLRKTCPALEPKLLCEVYTSAVGQPSARAFNNLMARAVSQISGNLLDYWETKVVADASNRKNETCADAGAANEPSCERQAELFVALVLTNTIRKIAWHVQRLMLFLIFELLMLLWALDSYPFQPKSVLSIAYYVFILGAVGYFGVQLVKFSRDEVLSRLSKTTPNEVTFDASFVTTMLTYVVLPLVGLAVTQVPEIAAAVSTITTAFSKSSGG